MAFGTLTAKLALDASAYEAGLNRAKKSSLDFGANLERTVGNKLKSAFGIGGLIAVTITSWKAMSALLTSGREFDKLAADIGVTTSELFRLQAMAKESETSWETFQNRIKATGQTLREFSAANPPTASEEAFGIQANRAAKVGERFESNKESITQAIRNFFIKWVAGMETLTGHSVTDPNFKPGVPGFNMDTGRAGEMTGPANPFTTPLNAFEISRRSSMPNVNALQAAGAATRLQGETTELKTAVQVLRNIDFTLKKIDTKSSGENLVLAP